MTMLEIIEKKKFGQELTKEEIAFFANAADLKYILDCNAIGNVDFD